MNKARTDEFKAVGFLVVLKVGAHIPVFHPFGYDAKLGVTNHLDPLNGQDVVMLDLSGNQHRFTESPKVA